MRVNGICVCADTIWFTVREVAGLLKLDMNTGKIRIVHTFDDYPLTKESVAGGIVKVENRLVIAPLVGDYIYVYEIDTDKMHRISSERGLGNTNRKFSNPIYKNGYIWMPGREEEKVLKLSVSDLSISEVSISSFSSACHTYLSVFSDDDLLCFNEKGQTIIYDTKEEKENDVGGAPDYKCGISCRYNGRNYFVGSKGICEINDKGEHNLFLPDSLNKEQLEYYFAADVADGMILFPYRSNPLVKITKDNNVKVLMNNSGNEITYTAACSYEEVAYAYNNRSNCIELYDADGEKIKSYSVFQVDNILDVLKKEDLEINIIREGENGGIKLNDFLSILS